MSIGSAIGGSGVTVTGLGSGIDTSSIVSKLIAAESIPMQQLQTQQANLQSQQTIYAAFGAQLQAISTAASALNAPGAFNTVAASSSDTTVANITSSTGATAGAYNLSVTQLAQAEKVASSAQTDTTSALNLTPGTFSINGNQVTIDGSDSLKSIAQKINGLQAGVTASLIDGGSGSAYLTLTSTQSGAGAKISMADISGNALSSLGLTGAGSSVREAITGGETSVGFSSQSSTLQSLIPGLPQNMTMNVNGTDVAIDTTTDTLQSIANKLSALPNVQASVRAVTTNGTTSYKLDIKGIDGTAPTVTGGTLSNALGVTQAPAASELLTAQDAKYTLDSIHLSSSSNTITSAIPGATLTLLKGSVATPGTATLSLSQDTSSTIGTIQGLVTAYNSAIDFISSQSQLDTTTFATGPLFGDPVAQQVQSNLLSMVVQQVPGVTGAYNSLQSLGFSVDDTGHLAVDSTQLTTALTNNPTDVAKLFSSTGSSAAAGLSYVSSTSKSVSAGASSYNVNITQPATTGSYTGEIAQASPSTFAETLTFNGALFGSSPYKLVLPTGSTAANTVAAINSDAKLKDMVSASLNTQGVLQITSKKFGANGNFTVGSDHESSTSDSGIGFGSAGVSVIGLDVAGTINGEVATGNGQFLTGNANNKTTDGLQIQYTGSATGLVGGINFTKGIASNLSDQMLSFTDPVSGLLTSTENSLTTQINDMTTEIATMQKNISADQDALTTKYNNMETAISALQQQGAQLTAMFSSGTTTSSTG
jgi:flagellar hook-associated protein 2